MKRRIGVYVCHCGLNIAGTVDVKAVAEAAKALDSVVVARDYEFMCAEAGQALLRKDITESGLNRVVVAACSPRLHEVTFRHACQEAGLNPYLYEPANIREQCSWVHHDRQPATEKAMALVRTGVRRVHHLEPLTMEELPFNPNTLVVGGGIAGIQAALDIADSGHKVYLVERQPSIGGHAVQLDTTFPTLDCSECILMPKMALAGSHRHIELMTYSEVEEVTGHIGNFKVKIRQKARYVDENRCNGCGVCQEKCPAEALSEFNLALRRRKAIYIPFPQAMPNLPVIDREHCIYFREGTCRVCEQVCAPKAIDFEQVDCLVEVEVGAVILATGYEPFDAQLKPEYGYGVYPNVITGLELERLLSPAGPTQGAIRINGKVPQNVVFIQCVGSRDKTVGHEYCSRVCCMYTAKHAHFIRERIPEAKVSVFYIDVRAWGKGGEQLYERVQKEGVLYRRGSVSEIYRRGDKLVVRAEDTLLGELIEEEADLVVLATGLVPGKDAAQVMRMFAVSPDLDGFFAERHIKLDPVATFTDGVFIVGCCQGPKDIADTVVQASAGAAKVLALISKGKVAREAATAFVDEEVCNGCAYCEVVCPYRAIQIDPKRKVARVIAAVCNGCGACTVNCPPKAIQIKNFTPQQIMDMIDVATGESSRLSAGSF